MAQLKSTTIHGSLTLTIADDQYGIFPSQNKYNTIGKSELQWYQVHAKQIYEDGTALESKYSGINHTHNDYVLKSGDTMSGPLKLKESGNALLFRHINSSFSAGISTRTDGNEAMCFENKNAASSFIFRTFDPTSTTTSWSGAVPSMQIKNQRVTINKLIANDTDAAYNLDVNGTLNANTLYENGTSISEKYSGINHTHTKADIGLGNVDNTADINKTVKAANILVSKYNGDGGKISPSDIGTNATICCMMNGFTGLTTPNLSGYMDTLMMNAYRWDDVPYATALGIQKINGIPRAWIAAGGNTTNWAGVAELVSSNNIKSYTADLVSNSAPTLSWGTTSTIGTVAGKSLTVKMPSNPVSVTNSAPTLDFGKTSTIGTISGTKLTASLPENIFTTGRLTAGFINSTDEVLGKNLTASVSVFATESLKTKGYIQASYFDMEYCELIYSSNFTSLSSSQQVGVETWNAESYRYQYLLVLAIKFTSYTNLKVYSTLLPHQKFYSSSSYNGNVWIPVMLSGDTMKWVHVEIEGNSITSSKHNCIFDFTNISSIASSVYVRIYRIAKNMKSTV